MLVYGELDFLGYVRLAWESAASIPLVAGSRHLGCHIRSRPGEALIPSE